MTYLKPYKKDTPPTLLSPAEVEQFGRRLVSERQNADLDSDDSETDEEFGNRYRDGMAFLKTKASKVLFIEATNQEYLSYRLENLTLSHCYSCKQWAVWIADNLIYPNDPIAIEPNDEMPPEIRLDFKEAADIVDRSPRGAAALLRLCVQKLMVHLDLPGKKIDDR
jgi:hypothetical protein